MQKKSIMAGLLLLLFFWIPFLMSCDQQKGAGLWLYADQTLLFSTESGPALRQDVYKRQVQRELASRKRRLRDCSSLQPHRHDYVVPPPLAQGRLRFCAAPFLWGSTFPLFIIYSSSVRFSSSSIHVQRCWTNSRKYSICDAYVVRVK